MLFKRVFQMRWGAEDLLFAKPSKSLQVIMREALRLDYGPLQPPDSICGFLNKSVS
jgi:hypothetical protein